MAPFYVFFRGFTKGSHVDAPGYDRIGCTGRCFLSLCPPADSGWGIRDLRRVVGVEADVFGGHVGGPVADGGGAEVEFQIDVDLA